MKRYSTLPGSDIDESEDGEFVRFEEAQAELDALSYRLELAEMMMEAERGTSRMLRDLCDGRANRIALLESKLGSGTAKSWPSLEFSDEDGVRLMEIIRECPDPALMRRVYNFIERVGPELQRYKDAVKKLRELSGSLKEDEACGNPLTYCEDVADELTRALEGIP